MKHWIHSLFRILLLVMALTAAIAVPQATLVAYSPNSEEPGRLPAAFQQPAAPSSLTRAFSGGPNYDSGWVTLAQNQSKTLVHNLGGSQTNYVVDMQYRNNVDDGINLRYYGGADFGTAPAPGHVANNRVGAYWRSLTTESITVYRRPEDSYAEQVRIRIWIDIWFDYDSGWRTIGLNETLP